MNSHAARYLWSCLCYLTVYFSTSCSQNLLWDSLSFYWDSNVSDVPPLSFCFVVLETDSHMLGRYSTTEPLVFWDMVSKLNLALNLWSSCLQLWSNVIMSISTISNLYLLFTSRTHIDWLWHLSLCNFFYHVYNNTHAHTPMSGLWLINPVILYYRKLTFYLSAGISCK